MLMAECIGLVNMPIPSLGSPIFFGQSAFAHYLNLNTEGRFDTDMDLTGPRGVVL